MSSVKFIFYAMLAYLLLQAISSLMKIIAGQGGLRAGPGPSSSQERSRRDAGASRPRPESERATRLREDEDIEDARWEDLPP